MHGYVPNLKLRKKMKRLNGDLKCFIYLFPFLVLKIWNMFRNLGVELKLPWMKNSSVTVVTLVSLVWLDFYTSPYFKRKIRIIPF